MKKIKIKICNYNKDDVHSYGFYLLNILNKYYEIEFSENPDYLFYSESTLEYLNYDCIKVFYTGENLHPNFNLCDYAIGFDYMDFGDRYYRLPVYLLATYYRDQEIKMLGTRNFTTQLSLRKEDLSLKKEFCSFVYSNYLSDSTRGDFFKLLSSYKKVNSGGAYLNNVGGRVSNKLDFESKHKFSIAFENSSREGYTTEKLPTALMANTIPIYWGNPEIGREFNTKRFINCHDYENFDAVVKKIKELDSNDDMYLDMINQPVTTSYDFEATRKNFEVFLRKIIDQPYQQAKRRKINPVRAAEIERNEKTIARIAIRKTAIKTFFAKLYKPFKGIKTLEEIKQKYFANKFLKK